MYSESFLNEIILTGRYHFTLNEANESLGGSLHNTKIALHRLTAKKRVMSIYKGFYVIIPPEYSARNTLPPDLFIDSLMTFLKKPYYVALQNAAAYLGAGHFRAQAYTVMVKFPNLRDIRKNGTWIQFISTRTWPSAGIQTLKSDTGYFNVSGPELTALDLVKYEKNAGGIDHVAQILSELCESLSPNKLETVAVEYPQTTVLQRLGYLIDSELEQEALSEALWRVLKQRKTYLTQLQTGSSGEIKRDHKWKVKVNTEIDLEL